MKPSFFCRSGTIRAAVIIASFLTNPPRAPADVSAYLQCVRNRLEVSALKVDSLEKAREIRALAPNPFLENGAPRTAMGGPNEDYLQATWLRDSAITAMGDLELRLGGAHSEKRIAWAIQSLSKKTAEKLFDRYKGYVAYLRSTQDEVSKFGPVEPDPSDPHATLQITYGEGRFDTRTGKIITDPQNPHRPQKWLRPQNDGPGRALTFLSWYGEIALRAGKEDYVRKELFDDRLGDIHGVLKRYAEYVSHEGRSHLQPSGDAWEQKLGHHFDTANAQAGGLYRAGKLALHLAARSKKSGNLTEAEHYEAAARHYFSVAEELKRILGTHWSPTEGSFASTLNPSPFHHPELDIQHDALNIISLVQAKGAHVFIPLTDDRVLSSVHVLENEMQRIMPAESVDQETRAVPIGRDMKDRWTGENPRPGKAQPEPGTYPWFLATADWANFYSTVTAEFIKAGRVRISAVNLPFFSELVREPSRLHIGEVLRSTNPGTGKMFSEIIEGLSRRANRYLKICTDAVQPGGNTGEGFDPITKQPKGPQNLTWNGVEFQRLVDQWLETQALLQEWREKH